MKTVMTDVFRCHFDGRLFRAVHEDAVLMFIGELEQCVHHADACHAFTDIAAAHAASDFDADAVRDLVSRFVQ